MINKTMKTYRIKMKARKEQREKVQAKALGLTVEEYRANVKHEKKIRAAERKVERLMAELAKAEKYLENLKKGVDKNPDP